jgi:hypothetical protein
VTDVLVPLTDLAGDSWRVDARIGELRLPVHHASPEQLSLSAPASDVPLPSEPIVVAPDGTVRYEQKDAA